ncbi:MAG: hypothetical protein NC433_02940 [Clostridiales bacterium]|nr:hypothetical protein [Clostridiales bacterium]
MDICNTYNSSQCIWHCPVAGKDERADKNKINSCKECINYQGCTNCFYKDTDVCPKYQKG